MKKIFFVLLANISLFQMALASGGNDNILGISEGKLREGKIHVKDIPGIIKHAIDFFMGIAGTIAVIFVIIGAYKILFWSLKQEKTQWRDTIIAALGGFALAALSWLIVRFIMDNLG